jgi:hypothetical protein
MGVFQNVIFEAVSKVFKGLLYGLLRRCAPRKRKFDVVKRKFGVAKRKFGVAKCSEAIHNICLSEHS